MSGGGARRRAEPDIHAERRTGGHGWFELTDSDAKRQTEGRE